MTTDAREIFEDPRITAVGMFGEAYLGLMTRLSCQIAHHDLSTIEFEILIRLARSPDSQLRMTDLSAQTSLTASGVTRVVDRLEKDGLVRRAACPTDRRSLYAVITKSGLDRVAAILPGHLELISEWFTGRLTPEELDAFLHGLRIVRDTVRPGAEAGANEHGQIEV